MTGEERHADETPRVAPTDEEYGREWTEQERDHLFPPGWPYSDLALRLRNCPRCGFEAVMLTAVNIHPMAFCHNDECRVLCWDPSRTATDTVHGFDRDDEDQAEGS